MAHRPPERSVAEAIRSVSFTPGRRDLPALFDMLAGEELGAEAAERALARMGRSAAEAALLRLEGATAPLRGRLVRVVGRVAAATPTPALVERLLALLEDPDPKARRNAIIAAGKIAASARSPRPAGAPGAETRVAASGWPASPDVAPSSSPLARAGVTAPGEPRGSSDGAARGSSSAASGEAPARTHGEVESLREHLETALLGAWDRETRVDHRRSLAAALGKAGGARARDRLAAVSTEDPELRRIVDEALVVLGRNRTTVEESGVDPGARASRPLTVTVRCRAGIERWLLEELGALAAAEAAGEGRVRLRTAGPLGDLFAARTMLGFGFVLPAEPAASDEEVPAAVGRAVAAPLAGEIFAAFGRGSVRYRIAWAAGGKRRAVVWRTVAEIGRLRPELVNDPSRRAWDVVIERRGGAVAVELCPRLPDPRFSYRRGDVPAASHPTIAAALARLAGARTDDVVWDPFVGSATELVERARLGPYAALHGSDVDPAALAVARENLAAAEVEGAILTLADACGHAPAGVSLVLTNPPMGRRLHRSADLASFLDRFLAHAAGVLVPGGRLVWITPFPERAVRQAAASGFAVGLRQPVDMGGFRAEIQLLLRGGRRSRS